MNNNDVEAIVEVLAEAAVGDEIFEIAIRRGDHADIDLDRFARAERLNFLRFDRAQELGLSGRAELSDFIEEKRARIRLRELACFGSISAGKRAALIAEQFALEKRFGNRSAIHRHEAAGAPAEIVEGARGEILTRSAFARDQDGAIDAGSESDLAAHASHRIALSDKA